MDQKASCAEFEVRPKARSLTLEGVALSEHPSSGPVAQAIRELLESRPTVLEVASQSGTTGNVLSWDGGGRRNRPLNFAEGVPTRLTVLGGLLSPGIGTSELWERVVPVGRAAVPGI